MNSQAYKQNYNLIDWSDIRPVKRRSVRSVARSSLPIPMFIRDDMEPTWHPITGEMVSSKREFTKTTLAHGYEEVGNDQARFSTPTPKRGMTDQEAESCLSEAAQMVNQGFDPYTMPFPDKR